MATPTTTTTTTTSSPVSSSGHTERVAPPLGTHAENALQYHIHKRWNWILAAFGFFVLGFILMNFSAGDTIKCTYNPDNGGYGCSPINEKLGHLIAGIVLLILSLSICLLWCCCWRQQDHREFQDEQTEHDNDGSDHCYDIEKGIDLKNPSIQKEDEDTQTDDSDLDSDSDSVSDVEKALEGTTTEC